eukprot:EG_transcript_23921
MWPREGRFEVVVGQSLRAPASGAGVSYQTLKVDFLPDRIDFTQPGSLQVSAEGAASAQFASRGDAVFFEGAHHPSKRGTECVLLWNEATGKVEMELVTGCTSLKQVPHASTQRPCVSPPPPPGGVAPVRPPPGMDRPHSPADPQSTPTPSAPAAASVRPGQLVGLRGDVLDVSLPDTDDESSDG